MRKLTWTLTLLLATACQQNPYEGKHAVEGPRPAPPPAQKALPPPVGAWGLKVQDEMVFTEGQKSVFPIAGTVPTPGFSQITVTGLPNGATFDPSTGKLEWTPDFQAANDPQNPLATSRLYNIQVELTSSADNTSSMVRQAVLLVNDVPQPANIKSPLQMNGQEGYDLVHTIEFEDNEFAQGPFDASLSGFPSGTQLQWNDHTQSQFQIVWHPGADAVVGSSQKNYGGHVIVYNPRGRRLEFDVVWTIQDQPLAPLVSGPSEITQAGNVTFMVMAEDQNGEEQPQWEIENRPAQGDMQILPSALDGHRSTALITWRGIPKSQFGQPYDLQINVCVKGHNYCTPYEIEITPTAGGK